MKILSISVAAYNMEKLIRQNLDSFVQSPVADDVEVLVVNDGSKDSTADIVREYEEKYPGIIRLINQENAGPGSTVNTGLKNATGKYFRMVDADDWVGDGFESYVQALKGNDADMFITDYTLVDDKTFEQRPLKVEGIAPNQTVDFDSVCADLFLEMHTVTFRTSLLKENAITLFNGFYTDIQYLLFPAPYIKTVYYAPYNVYMYRVSLSGQSMAAPSMQRNIRMHTDMLFSIVELYNRIKDARPTVGVYILKKLVMLCGTQMSTLLSFKPDKERKKDLYDFFTRIAKECPDAYAQFKKLKTTRVLLLAGGVFYTPVSCMHRKRVGMA